MANSIKNSGGGLALQVTNPAREAGFVDESPDGDATRLAEVYVYGFENLLLVVDAERVSTVDRAALVASAARDTDSIYEGARAELEVAGNGYQVQLPGCRTAGFEPGTRAPVITAAGALIIHDGTNPRLASDLATIRGEQVSS